MSHSKEKNSYTLGEKLAAVRIIRESQDWKEIQAGTRHRLSSHTLSLARVASGGASADQIRIWLQQDLSEEAVRERLSHRGAPLKFSEAFVDILVGYAIHRRLELKPVSAQDLSDFALGFFDIEISSQRISEILNEYGFSSQLSMPRNSRMTDRQVAEDCVKFILNLRRQRVNFPRLWVMDETGLWSNVVQRQTYHFRNLCEITSFLIPP